MTPVFFTFLQNHDTYVTNEGFFYFLTYDGQNPLSISPNSSIFGQKHIFSAKLALGVANDLALGVNSWKMMEA